MRRDRRRPNRESLPAFRRKETQPGAVPHEQVPGWKAALKRPLCIDLFCGLGGWAEGFLAEGYDVIGFDIERRPYPGQLVLQDVLTLHSSQFRNAAVIVASPPCQAYSYRAMPWKRAKALPPPSNELFDACFRIQREASEAAGRYIPLVVENVCGAQRWVGRARWHYGSFYLWGDVPALMPVRFNGGGQKVALKPWFGREGGTGVKNLGGSWLAIGSPGQRELKQNPVNGCKGFAGRFEDTPMARFSSRSDARKQASAEIAKIPFDLANHIARVHRPDAIGMNSVRSDVEPLDVGGAFR